MMNSCYECSHGIQHVCSKCGKIGRYNTCYSEQCIHEREIERNAKKFEKATKSTYDKVPSHRKEMMYSEVYPYDEGYFSDLDELYEACEDNDIEIPEYVWSTVSNDITLNAVEIVENACCYLHEQAIHRITGIEELQEFLDKWCAKQKGTKSYIVNYEYAILTKKE